MKTSDAGLRFIEQREGKRFVAYLDSVGIPTIGVGHTGPEVHIGQIIDNDEVTRLLREDLHEAEDAVNALVQVDLDQNQFDALVSFVFNLGAGAFSKSTLLRKINSGDFIGAADEFEKWDHAGGRQVAGLTARRKLEAALFQNEYTA